MFNSTDHAQVLSRFIASRFAGLQDLTPAALASLEPVTRCAVVRERVEDACYPKSLTQVIGEDAEKLLIILTDASRVDNTAPVEDDQYTADEYAESIEPMNGW